MLINKLVIKNFRNIKNLVLDTSARRVILRAENGQGKTNLLEALYLLCYGSSFRTNNLKDCINYDSSSFYLKSFYNEDFLFDRNTEVFVSKENMKDNLQNNFLLSKAFSSSRILKIIKIDSKEIKDRSELIYNIPCIVFSHDDIEFIRGEPESRRRFFDQIMTMYDKTFFDYQRKYKQILKQRNISLKEEKHSLLDIYDLKLASYGLYLIKERKRVCAMFSEIFSPLYSEISNDDKKIKIEYKPSWREDITEDEIVEKLYSQRDIDMKMKSTTSGPHRDKFLITDKNGLFVNSASTGQMRLASVVLRSAQASFFRKKTGKNPIFLIDDVLLEMDAEKRAKYLSLLGNYDQAFFTFLPEEKYYDDYFNVNHDNTITYSVKNGEFEKEEM